MQRTSPGFFDYIMYHYDKITDFQRLQHEIEQNKTKNGFKEEVKQMIDAVDCQPRKFKNLFQRDKRKPGWSPVQAMIKGEISADLLRASRMSSTSEHDQSSYQKQIEVLNQRYRSNWKPREAVRQRHSSQAMSPPLDLHAARAHLHMSVQQDSRSRVDDVDVLINTVQSSYITAQ